MGARRSPGSVLALAALAMALLAPALALAPPAGTRGFAYLCVSGGGSFEAGYVASPRVYYVFVHSVHKSLEVDVLEVTREGFKPSLVYLRDFGAGTPEDVVGEFDGFIVARAAVGGARPSLVVSSRGNPTVTLGAAGTWLSMENCAYISLVPVAG